MDRSGRGAVEREPGGRWRGALAATACVLAVGPASAADEARSGIERPAPVLQAPPEDLSQEDLDRYWSQATEIEQRALTDEEGRDLYAVSRELERASNFFEQVAESPSGRPSGHWRAARAVWLSGEVLPLDEKQEKLDRFQRAEALANVALERDPDCGECMLWKFIAMGRAMTTGGVMDEVRALPEMSRLLERAIELQPTHRDSEDNSTLGNLYYSSAIFNRLVPDLIILKWMTGVRGDKWKALEHSRKALALHPNRLDYQIEVGTQLLCIGTAKRKRERLEEGRRMIAATLAANPEASTEDERREIYFAKKLLEEPKKACGYTGDDIVDIESDAKQKTGEK
jgi:tetratricopeptide (TPR) repeat protein